MGFNRSCQVIRTHIALLATGFVITLLLLTTVVFGVDANQQEPTELTGASRALQPADAENRSDDFDAAVIAPAPIDSIVRSFDRERKPSAPPKSSEEPVAHSVYVELDPFKPSHLGYDDPQRHPLEKVGKHIGVVRELSDAVDISQYAGSVTPLSDGGNALSFLIHSPGATGIRLHLQNVNLPEGVLLWVQNANEPYEYYGPYDNKFIADPDSFWTESIYSDYIALECYVPPEVDPNHVKFQVGQIAHLYVSPEELLSNSGDCHDDVNCTDTEWQTMANAVAGTVSVSGDGVYWSSGVLLNNTNQDFTDYFMTANHCVGDQREANSTEFYWFYETESCDGAAFDAASVPRTGGGAVFLAGSDREEGSDFAFLRLRTPPPAGVTYAGWDAAPRDIRSAAVGIHHPAGSAKRISVGNTTTGSLAEDDYIRVVWSSGTTESGSSGSPLLDENYRFIGQLSAGDASCANASGSDEYGAFSSAWSEVEPWLNAVTTNCECDDAITLTGESGQVSGTNAGCASSFPVAWYDWTAPSSGEFVFETCGNGTDYDTYLRIDSGDCRNGTFLDADDDTCGLQSRITLFATGGTNYKIQVGGSSGITGNFDLNWNVVSPANCDCEDAEVLTGSTNEKNGSNFGCEESPAEVWYSWSPPFTGEYVFDTCGTETNFDTILEVYDGSCANPAYISSNDDACNLQSSVTFFATAGTDYRIAVRGYGGQTGNFVLAWRPVDCICPGESLSGPSGHIISDNLRCFPNPEYGYSWFNWTAPSSGMWLFEIGGPDTTISGAITVYDGDCETLGNSYDPRHFSAVGGTNYKIQISFGRFPGYGTFNLSWRPVQLCDCEDSPILYGSIGSVSGTNVSCTGPTTRVWYDWTSPLNGEVTFETCGFGTDFNTILEVFEGDCAAPLLLASNDDACDVGSRVTITASNGVTYRIAVSGFNGETGTYYLRWNDARCTVPGEQLAGPTGQVIGSTLPCAGNAAFYNWVAPESGVFVFDTCSANTTFDTRIYVTDGSRGFESDDTCGQQSRLAFLATAGTSYSISVDAGRGSQDSGIFELRWDRGTPDSSNCFCESSESLFGEFGQQSGSNVECASNSNKVWFDWTAPFSGDWIFQTCGETDFYTILEVFSDDCATRVQILSDYSACRPQSRVTLQAISGVTYKIAIDGRGDTGDFVLSWFQSEACSYSISTNEQTVLPSGDNSSFEVAASEGCYWIASSNKTWVSIDSDFGFGNGIVSYVVASNPSLNSRSATITVEGQTHTITQEGQSCSYTLMPGSLSFDSTGGRGSLSVDSILGCSWMASSNESWLTLTSGTSGTGDGTVTYQVAVNPSMNPRTATIAVMGEMHTIEQGGLACSYLVSPESASIASGGGSGSVDIQTQADCAWSASVNTAWVTITSDTSGMGDGTVGYDVAPNPTADARNATLTIMGQTHVINQAGLGCSFSVSSDSASFAPGGGSGAFDVGALAGCDWNASSNAAWVTITSGNSGSGAGSVSYQISANASNSARSTTITVAGQTHTINQSGSASTSGWTAAKRLSPSVEEKVLSVAMMGDGHERAHPQPIVALRLAASDAIEPDSVWAKTDDGAALPATWRAVGPEEPGDGWVIVSRSNSRAKAETLSVTAGAVTVRGEVLNTESVRIQADGTARTRSAMDNSPAAPLPSILASAASSMYRIEPRGLYAEPARVLIPLAKNADPDSVEVFYQSETTGQPGWYRGNGVNGWLTATGPRVISIDGAPHVELWVNHSGIVQLGQTSRTTTAGFDVRATGPTRAWILLLIVMISMGNLIRLYTAGLHDKNGTGPRCQ